IDGHNTAIRRTARTFPAGRGHVAARTAGAARRNRRTLQLPPVSRTDSGPKQRLIGAARASRAPLAAISGELDPGQMGAPRSGLGWRRTLESRMTASPAAAMLIPHLDLTSLGEDERPDDIRRLCARAAAAPCAPAALCVYPEHIATARSELDRLGLASVAVATVVNFPDGGADPGRVDREIRRALAAGADEIDAVLPYRSLLAGDAEAFRRVAGACREACGTALLKCILDTGELGEAALIAEA